jgi:exonuclease VII small subunit
MKTGASLSLSEKMERLKELENYFQQPELELTDALEKHKEAVGLGSEILRYLEEAESQLKKVKLPEVE